MSRSPALALLCGAAFVALPASAGAASNLRPDCRAKLLRSANHHRAIVVERHGNRAAGRDIVRWGRVHANQRTYKATCNEVRRYRRQLIVLHTAPRYHPLVVRVPATPYQAPAGTATASVVAPAGGVLAAIRACESGGKYSTNTGNGFFGAYQFTQSTWESVGGSGNPAAASPAEQDRRAAALYAQQGSSPWPVCGR